MDRLSAKAAPRAPRIRLAARSLILAALGAGLWLTGEATASAQEIPPPLTAPGATSPDVVETAATAVAPATAAAAPVVRAAAPVVHPAIVPVADLTEPVAHSAQPVLQQVAPLQDVVADAAGPLVGALHPRLAPALDVLTSALGADPVRSQEPLEAGHRLTGGVPGGAGDPGRAAHLDVAVDVVILPAAGPGGAAGGTPPMRPPTPATGGPAPAWCTGVQSFDQSSADLPAAAEATISRAQGAASGARDAAGDHTSDPCFSPD